MRCQTVIDEFLRDYFDRKLSLGERFRFRLHLAHCRRCRLYLDSYGKTVALTKAANANPAEAREVPEELVKAILAAQRPRD